MRYLDSFIVKDLEKRMVLLSGPRQCGKTTLSLGLLERRSGEYLNWDQPKDRKRILSQDWSEDTQLLVLDEIHKKKTWKNFVKGIYDTKPDSLQLLVTGSARLELFQKSGDSMFGRFSPWRLHPFCLAEDPLKLPPQERYQRMLERGGFPVPYLAKDPDDVQRWRNQRWTLLLREDLRDLETVKNLQALELLAELLRPCAGNMISYANLAEDAEIAPKTAKAWIHILEKLYLVVLVSPYARSIKRGLSKTPKLYFIDPGDLAEQSIGARVENLVAINLLKRLNFIEDAYGDRVELHYVRDKEGREVDFLITKNRKPVALIEVKTSSQDPAAALTYYRDRLGVPFAVQLHSDVTAKSVVKQGVRIVSLQSFFSQPIATRAFWE